MRVHVQEVRREPVAGDLCNLQYSKRPVPVSKSLHTLPFMKGQILFKSETNIRTF